MAENFPLMIPGASSTAGTLKVVAPWDRSEIGTVALADEASVEQALSNAQSLYLDRDRWLPGPQRVEILEKAIAIMRERADELARESAREGGKPLADSIVEINRCIDSFSGCIEVLRTEAGEVIPMGVTASSAKRFAFTRREAIGVVVAVSAFNHPLNLIAHQIGPAIAIGAPVLVKPAKSTPLSCCRLVSILREAGLPEEWCQVVIPADNQLSTQMVSDPRVAFFSFIGSAKVGWMLRSKLAPGARCALEHGGVAPVIVAADADLDDATPLLAKGGFYHAGQVCVSVQRVFAHESIAKDLAERLAKAGNAMKVGDPTESSTEVGPLIEPEETDRVEAWVNEAVEQGAECLSGGKRLSDTSYAPTVLYDPPADVQVSTQEVFGPVVCVYPYSDMDEAIARANSLSVSFQAAVWSRDINTAIRCYERLHAAAVMINDHTAFRVDWMPFAGAKTSGHGVGGIPYTMHEMSVEKLMVLRSPEILN